MVRKADSNSDELVQSYSAWLSSLQNALNKKFGGGHASKIARQLLNVLNSGVSVRDRDYLEPRKFANTVRTWTNKKRLSLPSKQRVTDALIALVEEYVPSAPKAARKDIGFREIVYLLQTQRNKNQVSGKSQISLDMKLYKSGILSERVSLAKELDERTLGLGSWCTDGEVPQYVERAIDSSIMQHLNVSNPEALVLVGEPKSGKTRSLLHNLKKSNLSRRKTYLLSPEPGSIEKFLSLKKNANPVKEVVILDDLQNFFSRESSAFQNAHLEALFEKYVVVATLHSDVLARWVSLTRDHSQQDFRHTTGSTTILIRPSARVLEKLQSNAISLNSSINQVELVQARSLFERSMVKDSDLRNLAAYLASVDFLEAKAKRAIAEAGLVRATMQAIIDVRFGYPDGLEKSEYLRVAEANFEQNNPNIDFPVGEWEETFKFFLTGINSGSPHSILVRNASQSTKYKLLDALWPKLISPEWNGDHLTKLPNEMAFEMLASAFDDGYGAGSRDGIKNLAEAKYAKAQTMFGFCLEMENDVEGAENWYRQAVELGEPHGMNNLGRLLHSRGETNEAISLLKQAVEAGSHQALNSLGVLYQDIGETDEAEKWYLRGLEARTRYSATNLARMKLQKREFDSALEAFKAAPSDDQAKYANQLGIDFSNLGALDAAIDLFTPLAEAGDASAANNLGITYGRANKTIEQEAWLRKAVDLGSKQAAGNLALALQESDNSEAERWFRVSAQAGDPDSMNSLARLLKDRPEGLVEAKKWLRKSAKLGNLNSLNMLGNQAGYDGQYVEAERHYRKAIAGGYELARVNLARTLAHQGKTLDALKEFEKVKDKPSWAYFEIGQSLVYHDEYVEGIRLLRKAKRLGEPEAEELLQIVKINHPREWAIWFRLANTEAQVKSLKSSVSGQSGDNESSRIKYKQTSVTARGTKKT
jgi:TPR repeat protein